MVRSSMLISVILLVNLFVGPLTFIAMPTQGSWLPLSLTIIGSRLISNAFAESVENQEEKGEEGGGEDDESTTTSQDDNDNSDDNTEPSVEGNDNDDNNGKNENNDGKEQEGGRPLMLIF